MKITFTGKTSQIGEYFKADFNFVSYDLTNDKTWGPLLDSDVVFMLLPKSKHTLSAMKKFLLTAMNSNIRQIIKIGSLGPWRVIHKQIEHFMKEARINYTSFDIAPMMNNIFTEQYDPDNNTLLDYRGNAPAPYLDPICLASAIESSVGNTDHFNMNYSCTGLTQYTINDVKNILNSKGYAVDKVADTTSGTVHKQHDNNPDFLLMQKVAERYKTEGWFPPISEDLVRIFGQRSRSLENFIDQDKKIFEKRLDLDDCL